MDYIMKNSKKYGMNASRGKYCPRFLFCDQAEANFGCAFFFLFQAEAVQAEHSFTLSSRGSTGRAFFYAIKQRQILAALSFKLSSRGKYWPRILLSFIL
jgi:hypothetical protein